MRTCKGHLAASRSSSARPLLPCCANPPLRSRPNNLLVSRQLQRFATHAAAGGSTDGAQVLLKVHKPLPFGQQLALVSSDKDWSTDRAIKLKWAEGDVWSCSLALESSTIDYKFAVIDGGPEVLEWQPGDNRSLSVPDGAAVEVFDSWEGGERQVQVLGASSAPRQPPPSDGPGEKSSAPAAAEASAVAVAPADTELPVASKAAAPGLAAEPAADLVLPAAAVIASQVPSTEAVSDSSGASAAPAHAALEGGGLSASAGDRTVETAPLEAPRKRSVRGKAGRSAVSSSGTCGEEQMVSLTVLELRAMAKLHGIRGAWQMNKKELIMQLVDATSHSAAAADPND